MYQMLTFSLMKYQIFPETWVIMSFTILHTHAHTHKNPSACHNIIPKSLKFLSHILEKPREIEKNQEVGDFSHLKTEDQIRLIFTKQTLEFSKRTRISMSPELQKHSSMKMQSSERTQSHVTPVLSKAVTSA